MKKQRKWKFQDNWKVGRDWLYYDSVHQVMKCKLCMKHQRQLRNLKGHSKNWWTAGADSLRKSMLLFGIIS